MKKKRILIVDDYLAALEMMKEISNSLSGAAVELGNFGTAGTKSPTKTIGQLEKASGLASLLAEGANDGSCGRGYGRNHGHALEKSGREKRRCDRG